MGEVSRRAITPASIRTLSALTRPLLPPSHAAPRTPAMSAPSAAALGKSSAVSRPASAAMSPAACAASTQLASASSSRSSNKPGPFLSRLSSSTPRAPWSAATSITSCQPDASAYAANTSAHPAIRAGAVVLTNVMPASEPTGALAPSPRSPRAALTGRRPATAASIAERAEAVTGPSGPRDGSLASMISAPPSTAAAASAASATLTNSCMLGYANICP